MTKEYLIIVLKSAFKENYDICRIDIAWNKTNYILVKKKKKIPRRNGIIFTFKVISNNRRTLFVSSYTYLSSLKLNFKCNKKVE